ncbi:hypothetical protein predicted by Glimmer/Critica [Acetobacter ghanensis]|uniref:Uncharacterized protein n=1 Tax=Acetobacter ghanensis TaxID=431306 RepID=A0A0U5BLN9_9PROT|nr:hypothetical protein [Acetobacter ghanensis]CEF57132.1 hypothetical protein predicted by Glimmer/Critica [Acetobacter ghanensis]
MRGEQTLGVLMGLTLNTAQNDTIPIYNCQRPFSQKKKSTFPLLFSARGLRSILQREIAFFAFERTDQTRL